MNDKVRTPFGVLGQHLVSFQQTISDSVLADSIGGDVLVRDTLYGIQVELRKYVLTDTPDSFEHTTTVRAEIPYKRVVSYDLPLTRWQAFKQRAIDAGNPFFHPGKVRWRTVRVPVEGVAVGDVTVTSTVHVGHSYPLARFEAELGQPVRFAKADPGVFRRPER